MIAERTLWISRGAATSALALSLSLPLLCGQASAPAPVVPPPPSTVPMNARTGADDPRVGLKGGLYDAGEAASGLERVASLPKPPGFAPGNVVGVQPAPPPAATAAGMPLVG